jgi:hypothetical protein
MNNTQVAYTGIAYTMLMGVPLGLLTIAGIILAGVWYMDVYLDESFLFAFMAFALFVKPVIGLTVGFLLALWPIGRWVEKCFLKDQKLFWVSLKSSFVLNLVMWAGFVIPSIFQTLSDSILKPDPAVTYIIPAISLIISTILTTLTWGLLICFLVKRKLKKRTIVQESTVFQY